MAKKIRTMSDFATASGLSRPTVAKYFSDPRSVRDNTRRQIEEALEQYDYRPNRFAQNLNRRKPKTIGIVVPHLVDPFFAEIVRRIELRCIEEGYWAIVLSSHGEEAIETAAFETLLSLNLAGAIVAPLGYKTDVDLIRNLNDRIELVLLDSRIDVDAPFVGTDNEQSIALMVDYLCRTGEVPCYMDMPEVTTNAVERREAYARAMAQAGQEARIITTTAANWSFEEIGFTEASRQIASGGFPTRTVMCANDRIAFGVMAAACQNGLKIGRGPEADLRVAGHDDHPLSHYSCPALTTVAQDFAAIASTSLNLLLEATTENEDGSASAKAVTPGSSTLFPARLVMRSSA
ncbi:LacI family DNA-binding transcriptional regulator [Consotaella salsifontis]|uniref:DNA-binding transcriptional regulator, LacI/PurR family n=1 Tax=Consotaella salsifontis TaxID=1365950 RepID=A0A1T4LH79_9HYPH|nr:LacI family DNA-binding transcriptional regulator [Consotaella salsifontis]SJZ54040.1 DNA-binding transcriptional regulator, LacI/PurR family [Consotaella salsifontis]